MRRVKKAITFILAASVVTSSMILSGCTDKKSETPKETKAVVETQEGEFDNLSDATDGEYKIEEQTLIDKDGVVIVAKEYIKDETFGEGIKLYIENNTDKNLEFGCNELVVNGFVTESYFYTVVDARKSDTEGFYFNSESLKQYGIDNVGQMDILFNIYDSETNENIFYPDPVTVKTSAFDKMDTEADFDGKEIYNKNGIVVKAFAFNQGDDMGVTLYCENNYGKTVEFSVGDMNLNGTSVEPYFYRVVGDKKKLIYNVGTEEENLETNGVKKLEDVEITLVLTEEETLDLIEETKPIKLEVKEL